MIVVKSRFVCLAFFLGSKGYGSLSRSGGPKEKRESGATTVRSVTAKYAPHERPNVKEAKSKSNNLISMV